MNWMKARKKLCSPFWKTISRIETRSACPELSPSPPLNLDQMGKAGRLRADLLHRLKGGSMVLPPLRHNPDL